MNAEMNRVLQQMVMTLEGAGKQRTEAMLCEACGAKMQAAEVKKAGDGKMLCEGCWGKMHGSEVEEAKKSKVAGNKPFTLSVNGSEQFSFHAADEKDAASRAKSWLIAQYGSYNRVKWEVTPGAMQGADTMHDDWLPEAKQPKLGSGKRFKNLVKALDQRDDVDDPEALASWIGRMKYGAAKMKKMAAAGRK